MKPLVSIIYFLFGLIVFDSNLDSDFAKSKSYRIYFSSESSLKIKGTTNVNSFKCEYDISKFSDSLSVSLIENDKNIEFDDTELILPNINFNCGHRGITKDFNKLLKTKEFPEIRITILKVNTSKNCKTEVMVSLDITICGISNSYEIPVTINKNSGLEVSGLLPINIEDFKLEAPSKALGIIKVSNYIEIDFNLKILKC